MNMPGIRNPVSWARLDAQMETYAETLRQELEIPPHAIAKLATAIASEVRFLPREIKQAIGAASPISVDTRLEELEAFQGWMDLAKMIDDPFVARAQVITQTTSALSTCQRRVFPSFANIRHKILLRESAPNT
jgi:hypothetical protein